VVGPEPTVEAVHLVDLVAGDANPQMLGAVLAAEDFPRRG